MSVPTEHRIRLPRLCGGMPLWAFDDAAGGWVPVMTDNYLVIEAGTLADDTKQATQHPRASDVTNGIDN